MINQKKLYKTFTAIREIIENISIVFIIFSSILRETVVQRVFYSKWEAETAQVSASDVWTMQTDLFFFRCSFF